MEEVKSLQNKGEYEKLVDRTTPYANYFKIQANSIIKQKGNHEVNQVLLDIVVGRTRPFVFTVHITHTTNGEIMVGVVDRCQRQAQTSHNSGRALCYFGHGGQIFFDSNRKGSTYTGVYTGV
jgi:hypothetical protein